MEEKEFWKPNVNLIWITPNCEEQIELAYRNCYQSSPAKTISERREFIKARIKMGELSPLEFATATFKVEGSRVYTHQQVRHRIASYAQESQRYVQLKDPSQFIVPPEIQENPQALSIFLGIMNETFNAYFSLLRLGIKKENARYLLPQAVKSKIFVSMNFRAWRHFLKLRCDKRAHWEIREVAQQILKILYQEAPSVFGDLYQKFILQEKIELWTERD